MGNQFPERGAGYPGPPDPYMTYAPPDPYAALQDPYAAPPDPYQPDPYQPDPYYDYGYPPPVDTFETIFFTNTLLIKYHSISKLRISKYCTLSSRYRGRATHHRPATSLNLLTITLTTAELRVAGPLEVGFNVMEILA